MIRPANIIKGEVLHVNKDIMCIYTNCGAVLCKDEEEFDRLISQEKKKIIARSYVLDRFEHWEVNDEQSLKKLLLSRVNNNTEKELVRKYIEHLNKG